MSKRAWVLGAALAVGQAGVAAGEQTICTGYITTLPTTISTSGTWCFTSILTMSHATNTAITINVQGAVTIDLNGYRMQNNLASSTKTSIGINVGDNRRNITIRNGTIRGFYKGIVIGDTSGGTGASTGHLLEDLRIERMLYRGIEISSLGSVIRNNQVVDISGSSLAGSEDAVGIHVTGPGNRVLNNDVSLVVPQGAGTSSAIQMTSANGSVIEYNRIGNGALVSSRGINVVSGDVQVVASRVTTMAVGLFCDTAATGKYRDNLMSGVTVEYSGAGCVSAQN